MTVTCIFLLVKIAQIVTLTPEDFFPRKYHLLGFKYLLMQIAVITVKELLSVTS